jgi:hypothetical protein
VKYQTMTPMGGRGSAFEAENDEDAVKQASTAGYVILDIQYASDGTGILVIPDDE